MIGFIRSGLILALAALVGCSYSDVRTDARIDNALARAGTHSFAVAVNFRRVREPTGVLNTFPNGGVPKVLEHEARVYLVDVGRQTVTLAARIVDFADIPQPKSVRVEGWRDDALYFSLFGYGGDARRGDDLSDPRSLIYAVDSSGQLRRVDALPDDLVQERASGPLGKPPFLRLSKGYGSIDIGIDSRPRVSADAARFVLDADSGQPRLVIPDEP